MFRVGIIMSIFLWSIKKNIRMSKVKQIVYSSLKIIVSTEYAVYSLYTKFMTM